MAFEWTDRIDGEDVVLADDVNFLARGIKKNEEDINTANTSQQVIHAEVQELKSAQEIQTTELMVHQKRIENLENALYPDIVTPVADDKIAYTKAVPKNALPYAEVTQVGGMTYTEGNTLRSAPVTSIESVGKNILNVATATVWTRAPGSYDDYLKAEQYGTGIKLTALKDSTSSWWHGGFTIGLTKEFLGKTLALSVGNVEYFPKRDKSNPVLLFGICKHDNYYFGGSSNLGPDKSGGPTSLTFTVPLDADYVTYPYLRVSFYISGGGEVLTGDYVIYEDIMVEVADSASAYAPYTKHTLPVPASVQALEGYGEGVSDTIYNYIDFERKQFVQKVGKGASGEPFELAEPVITDISHLLSDDNYIPVEGGGSITMANEHGFAVPSTVEYTVKGASAQ